VTKGAQQGTITSVESARPWSSALRACFLRHEWLRGYTLLSPTLLVMIGALALPIFTLVVYSFWTQDYVHIDKTATLKNYETFLDKWMYGNLLLRSIRMSATVTIINIFLAFPIAYFLAFRVRKNIMTWLILINLPFWTSYLLRVLAWKIMLGNNGVINSSLLDLGIIQGPLEFLLYSRFAVILTLVHAWAAFAILPIYLSLSKIDRSLLEAAADLGESPFRTFLRVTLPLSMPGVIAAAVIQFIPTVGDYITPMMVGGPRGMMFGQIIAAQFGEANNMPLGSALTIIMMLTITAIVFTFIWLSQRGTVKRREMETVTTAATEPDSTGRRRFGPLFFYVILYLMFLYIPSLMLPVFSAGNDRGQGADPLSASRTAPGNGFHHASHGDARNHPGRRASGTCACRECATFPLDDRCRPRRRYRTVFDAGRDGASRGFWQEPRRVRARSRRELLDDVLASNLSADPARSGRLHAAVVYCVV
jgi:spermidine/putrescine transport system permease protein